MSQVTALSLGHRRHQSGARTEMAVCIDLIDRGFIPYRAMGAHAPFDVIAADGAHVIRIECRTGAFSRSTGTISYSRRAADGCDLFAIWVPTTGSVIYFSMDGTPQEPLANGAILPFAYEDER